MLCIVWALLDMKCIEAGRNTPYVPFRLILMIAYKNMKVQVFCWWLLILLVTLSNFPSYLAYCCSPTTPFVLCGILFEEAKDMTFFYISNIVFTIALTILIDLIFADVIDISIEPIIASFVYFF